MRAFSIATALLLIPLAAEAQPPSSYAEIRFVAETPVEIVVDRRTTLVAGGRSMVVPRSRDAATYAGTSDEGVLLAMLAGDAVRTVFVPVTEGRLGPPSEPRAVDRVEARDRTPVGAAVAPMPDGFAVFWQEAHTRNPSAAYTTYVQRFGPEGERRGDARLVQAVWPLAAAAYMPETDRFYFLLFYGGRDPRKTRLCGVHIDAETLRPQEHPWWASRPGLIDEGQLFVRGDQVIALYRGGPEGQRLLQVDVSGGSWGREAPAPRPRGRLGPEGVFGARLDGERLTVTLRPRPSR